MENGPAMANKGGKRPEDDRRSLDALGNQLQAIRSQKKAAQRREAAGPKGDEGLGLGLRIAVELVASVAVGFGLGFALDRWLGTGPWLLLVFLILGFAAGVLNVQRVAAQYERRKKAQRAAEREEG